MLCGIFVSDWHIKLIIRLSRDILIYNQICMQKFWVSSRSVKERRHPMFFIDSFSPLCMSQSKLIRKFGGYLLAVEQLGYFLARMPLATQWELPTQGRKHIHVINIAKTIRIRLVTSKKKNSYE